MDKDSYLNKVWNGMNNYHRDTGYRPDVVVMHPATRDKLRYEVSVEPRNSPLHYELYESNIFGMEILLSVKMKDDQLRFLYDPFHFL